MLKQSLLLMFTVLILTGGVLMQTTAQANPLPNGVAAGDIDQTSVVLWTRSEYTGGVTFEIATDADFVEIVATLTAEVADPLQPVRVEATDLTPGTRYYYRATDSAGASASGTFATPDETGTANGLRFGVSGDWRGELAPYPAVRNAAERQLDFFVLHGDTIYSDYPSPAVPVQQATTLEQYRLKHDEVYSSHMDMNTWADVRASTAVFAMIDDHEVTNDFAGGAPPASDRRFAGESVEYINDTALYETGLQAFQEYNPVRDEYYADSGDPRTAGERRLYRYRTFGSDAAIFLLDARSFRDSELPSTLDVSPEGVLAYEEAAFDPERTMLGAAQLADLQADLLDAQAAGITWKFIMVPEPMQNLGVVNASDRFEGYAAERTALLRFIVENEISNVVFVAADIHGTIVNDIFYREAAGGAEIPANAFEITTGSVAFDAPFGPTVLELGRQAGIVTEEQFNLFSVLPLRARDTVLSGIVNDLLVEQGYSAIGLDDSGLDVELVEGGWFVCQTYGWTEFEIDAETQALTVTTYGIPYYTALMLEETPEDVLALEPAVLSRFIVAPQ